MTLPRFLDCAYALLVEEYRSLGSDLLSALEKMRRWAIGGTERSVGEPVRSDVATRNEAALAELKKRMDGVA